VCLAKLLTFTYFHSRVPAILYWIFYENIFLSYLNFFNSINGHGFEAATKVRQADATCSIRQLYRNFQKQKLWVSSFNQINQTIQNNTVTRIGISKSNCFIRISFDSDQQNDILCTPSQEFFVIIQQRFIPACKLKIGDPLFSLYKSRACVSSIVLIERPLKVYAFEVARDHNYFVGNYGILVHNMFFPELTSLGGIVAPTITTGVTIGACFGPLSIAGSILLCGMIGLVIKYFSDKMCSYYRFNFDIDKVTRELKRDIAYKQNEDAQALGKPTEKDGFIPKKNWDGKKVKHRRGYGRPDRKGNVWIPTGPRGHGCPHWDVQKPNGDYENVVPGGRSRGQN